MLTPIKLIRQIVILQLQIEMGNPQRLGVWPNIFYLHLETVLSHRLFFLIIYFFLSIFPILFAM